MKTDAEFYTGCDSALQSRIPLLGAWRARSAARALAERRDAAESIPRLIVALSHPDEQVSATAEAALRGLRVPKAVDALCAAWAKARDERLGALVAECRYVAAQPVAVRILSALHVGAELEVRSAEEVNELVKGLDETKARLAENAGVLLRGLREPKAVDALCAAWAKTRDARLGTLLAECRYVAAQPVAVRILSALHAGAEFEARSAEEVNELVKSLGEKDARLAGNAEALLRGLREPKAVDALCAAWAKTRDARLGTLLAECRYVAAQPAAVRILSVLHVGAELEARSAEEVNELVKALGETDARLAGNAEALLRGLREPNAVDALCAAWAKARDARLGALVADCGYVAAQPLGLRILSAVQAAATIEVRTAEEGGELVKLLDEKDARLAENAGRLLRGLREPAAVEALCAIALREPESAAGRLCIDRGYRPADPEDAAVYLAATGQLDALFAEHEGLTELRAGYARADGAVQKRVNDIALKGDARLAPFIRQRRRTLREGTEQELKDAVEHSIRRKDWPQLFGDCQALPLRHALPGWQALAASGWTPDDPGEAAMLRQIAAALSGEEQPARSAGAAANLGSAFVPPGTSAVFEKWLEAGRQRELVALGEEELIQRLANAAPPQAVPIVAALAAGGKASEVARQRIARSEHWLIRLAGHVTGLVGAQVDASEDSNFWVREVAGADKSWNLWPEDATLEMMETAGGPREAALMAKSGPRDIFRAVLGQRMKGGVYTPRELPAGTEAGIFIPKEKKTGAAGSEDETFV